MTDFSRSVKQIFDILYIISEVPCSTPFPCPFGAPPRHRAPFSHFFLSAFHRPSDVFAMVCIAHRPRTMGRVRSTGADSISIAKEPEWRQWIAPHLITYELTIC